MRDNLPSPAPSLSVWELLHLLARMTVADAMTKTVHVVDPMQPASAAAKILLDRKIGALPVVDDGRPLGMLTEADFVRAFAEPVGPV